MQLRFLALFFIVVTASCTKQPEASFSADKNFLYEGETVTFTNSSLDAESIEWDFGDGTTSTELSPKKTFEKQGDYTVSLIAYSKKRKKTSVEGTTIHVDKAYVSATVNGDPLYMTMLNTGIDHYSANTLYSCGWGTNEGRYGTQLVLNNNGIRFEFWIGGLKWECDNPAPYAAFKAFFGPRSFGYSPDAANGVEIRYYATSGSYSTSTGSQSGSSFSITSVVEDNTSWGTSFVLVSGTFSCKVYSYSAQPITISGSFRELPFKNM
jgi:PKD repeat protein